MILLKIGSDPKNDIVLHSPYVSSMHAELVVNDDGTIIIEDKASTNGTTVNNRPLVANQQERVKRGDLIKFGDAVLPWNQVPVLPDASKYESIINIGSNLGSNIPVNNQFVSRYHATIYVGKDKKAYIYDYNSRNGTEINGNKVPNKKQVRIKRGDNITVGGVDVTDTVKGLLPDPLKWVKVLAGCLLGAVLLAAVAGVAFWAFGDKEPKRNFDINEAQKAVVLVYGEYSMYLKLQDNPIHQEIWEKVTEQANVKFPYGHLKVGDSGFTGTAFFLDRQGRMATNRHVAVPWEVADENSKREWRTAAEQLIHSQLPTTVHSEEQIFLYHNSNSLLWDMVYAQTIASGEDYRYANSLIRQLQNIKWEVVGRLDYFGVAYAGRHYDGIDELSRCTLLQVSDNPEIDLALIQLNDTSSMPALSWVFAPDDFTTERLVPQKDKLMWIGYPNGMTWARDPKIHQLRPQVRETTCSSAPSKFDFDIQGEIIGGASGSPVFEASTGKLVGVAYSRLVDGTTYGRAIQARYLKEMYDKEIQ